jgi:hypothetical protein
MDWTTFPASSFKIRRQKKPLSLVLTSEEGTERSKFDIVDEIKDLLEE